MHSSLFIPHFSFNQFFYLGLQVLDVFLPRLQLVGTVDEEVGRHARDVIQPQVVRIRPGPVAHADPGQVVGRRLPVVFVFVEGDLVDFQSLSLILVVEPAQRHVACRRLLRAVDGEVQQDDLPFQVRQPAFAPVLVLEGDVDESRFAHLVGREGDFLLPRRAGVFHSLDGEVVQVGRACRVGVEVVEARGDSPEAADVGRVVERVEEAGAVHALEEGEVGIQRVGRLEDVVHLRVLLVSADHSLHAVLLLVGGQRARGIHAVDVGLELDLLDGQFLDFQVGLALDGVARRHVVEAGLDADGLRRVDGEVDDVVVDAQAVELRILRLLAFEGERARGAQLDGVDGGDGRDAGSFQVEHLVGSALDGARYGEMRFFLTGREPGQDDSREKNAFVFHIFK